LIDLGEYVTILVLQFKVVRVYFVDNVTQPIILGQAYSDQGNKVSKAVFCLTHRPAYEF